MNLDALLLSLAKNLDETGMDEVSVKVQKDIDGTQYDLTISLSRP